MAAPPTPAPGSPLAAVLHLTRRNAPRWSTESSCKLKILDFETQPTATAGGYRLMTRLPRAVTACGNRVPGRGPARVGYTLTARAARKGLWSRAVTAYRGPPPRGRRSNRGESSRGPRLADAVTRGRFTRLPRRPRAVTASKRRSPRRRHAVTASGYRVTAPLLLQHSVIVNRIGKRSHLPPF